MTLKRRASSRGLRWWLGPPGQRRPSVITLLIAFLVGAAVNLTVELTAGRRTAELVTDVLFAGEVLVVVVLFVVRERRRS